MRHHKTRIALVFAMLAGVALVVAGPAGASITVSITPADGGTVHSWPEGIGCPDDNCSATFDTGTEVMLTATYHSGFQFDHWEGDASGTNDSVVVIADRPLNITAVFIPVRNPQTLTVSVSPLDAGVVHSWPSGIWCVEEGCTWDYPENEQIELTAEYHSGYQFDHWEGDLSGDQSTGYVTMDGPKTVTAVFVPVKNPQTLSVYIEPVGAGVVHSWPSGIWCTEAHCDFDYPQGVEVSLTADYHSGYEFSHWEGDASGQNNVTYVVMDTPRSVTAVFVPVENPQTLSVTVEPVDAGVVHSSPTGIWCTGGTCPFDFPEGAEVTLTADYQSGYEFDHWEGALSGEGITGIVTMDGPKSVTAVFVPVQNPRTLSVTVEPAGAGVVYTLPEGIWCTKGTCPFDFPEGIEVLLTATNQSGYEFDRWEGDLSGPDHEGTVTMDGPKSVTAVFVPVENPQTLSVIVTPPNAGVVYTSPDRIWCTGGTCAFDFAEGIEVILTATHQSGYAFDHWEGDLSGQSLEETVTMDGPKSVTAVFVPMENPQTLSVTVEPAGAGEVYTSPEGIWCTEGTCAFDFPGGSEVLLTAVSETGFQFDRWEGGDDDLAGVMATVIMDGPKSVTAVFTDADTVSVPPGSTLADLRMISFPYQMGQTSATHLFGDIYDYPGNHRIGGYDPQISDYREYGEGLTIETGRAIWILARHGIDITMIGEPVVPDADFELPLGYNAASRDGWNMIGPPSQQAFDWRELRVVQYDPDTGQVIAGPMKITDPANNLVSPILWKWRSGGYVYADPAGTYTHPDYEPDPSASPFLMSAGAGYWIEALAPDLALRFQKAAARRLSAEAATTRSAEPRQAAQADGGAGESSDGPPPPIGGLSGADSGSVSGGCFVRTIGK
jgi:hypothetical protein